MKKKSLALIFISLLILNLVGTQLIRSQNIPNAMPTIPGLGQINEETGLPETFEKFRTVAENLSEEESRKEYLYQEWTKILAKTAVLGPVLFYTNDILSTLNPIWEFIFQMKFAWSWEFIFALVIWIVLIVIITMPVKELMGGNVIITFIAAAIIVSLAGSQGVIKSAADTLTFAVKNIWLAVACLVLAIIIAVSYSAILAKFGKDLRKQSEEEDLKNAKEVIKAHGKISEQTLKEEYGKDDE